MSDKDRRDEAREATVGLKSDLKTLQQLTSSSEAAKKLDSKDERAKRNLFAVFEKVVKEEEGPGPKTGK